MVIIKKLGRLREASNVRLEHADEKSMITAPFDLILTWKIPGSANVFPPTFSESETATDNSTRRLKEAIIARSHHLRTRSAGSLNFGKHREKLNIDGHIKQQITFLWGGLFCVDKPLVELLKRGHEDPSRRLQLNKSGPFGIQKILTNPALLDRKGKAELVLVDRLFIAAGGNKVLTTITDPVFQFALDL